MQYVLYTLETSHIRISMYFF